MVIPEKPLTESVDSGDKLWGPEYVPFLEHSHAHTTPHLSPYYDAPFVDHLTNQKYNVLLGIYDWWVRTSSFRVSL